MSRRVRSLLFLVPLLLGAPCSCSSNRPSAEDLERQVEIHLESTVGYLNMKEYARAIDQATRGLSLDPDNFLLRLYLGRALQLRGSTEDVLRAEQVYRRLSQTEDFRVPLGLAEVLERKGIALDEAARAVESGRRYTEAPDPAARAGELRTQARAAWSDAAEVYARALELRPNDTEIMNGLLRIHTLLGRPEEALRWAEGILSACGADRSFWEKQIERPGLSVREEERFRDSIRALVELEVAVHMQAATLLHKLGRGEEAEGHLAAVVDLRPALPEAYSRRAQLLVEMGRYEEALAAIDRYLSLAKQPFEHPDVRRAFELKSSCEAELSLQR